VDQLGNLIDILEKEKAEKEKTEKAKKVTPAK
jgi:hypothetical protein